MGIPGAKDELQIDFFDALRSHTRARPDDVAIEAVGPEGRSSFSWALLVRELESVSRYLRDAGISPGDRVAILMENHPRWGVAFLAVQSAGAVAVPLDTISGVAAAAAVSQHAEAKFLIASPRLSDEAQAIRAEVPAISGALATEADWILATAGSAADSPFPLVPRSFEDPLTILYTGGTTGKPKGVLLSQRNLYRSITDMLKVFPLSPSDRVLSVLPLFHVMPLLANLLAPLYTGASVMFLNLLDPQSLMQTFASEGITAFLCVPQFYYQIERRIRGEVSRQSPLKQRLFGMLLNISRAAREKRGWRVGKVFFKAVHARFGGKLRAFGIGGAYMNPATSAFFADLGFILFQAYGLTESGGLASVTALDRDGGLTCGQAVANCEIRVLDPDPAGVGEILIRGENVMQGYWRDPESTQAVIRDGWLYTGDLGTLDGSGRLRLTGRAKDVIVLSSGKNVFPEELEEFFLKRCSLLQEICFVGLEGAHGAVLRCVAVPNRERVPDLRAEGAENEVRQEIAAAARALPSHKRPRSLQITDQLLPRTSTRKLQRFKVRDSIGTIASGVVVEPLSVGPSDPIERSIAALIGRIRATRISRDTHLELDLHFDSLERVELLTNVEKAFGISLTPVQAASIESVGDLIDIVRQRPAGTTEPVDWHDWTGLVQKPLSREEEDLASVYLRRRPVLEVAAYCLVRVLALGLKGGMRLKIRRPAVLPPAPFLLCPNHLSFLDEPVVIASLPFPVFRRMFSVAASKYLGGTLVKWLAAQFRVLPIDQEHNLLKGLRMAKAGCERGLILCVFPEGTRSSDGNLQELRKGTAILACALRIPVVPAGIDGTFEAWPRERTFPRARPVSISIGEAIVPEPGETPESFSERIAAGMRREIQTAKEMRTGIKSSL